MNTRPLSVCTKDHEALRALTEIHAPKAKLLLDCTWGKGGIWRGWSDPPFHIIKSDIDPYGKPDLLADYFNLPFLAETADVLVWDPPHLEDVGKNSLMAKYNGHATLSVSASAPWFIMQARRVLRPGGLLLTKIADSVHRGLFSMAHTDVCFSASGGGFTVVDCMIRVRKSSPNGNWKRILHVRSAHSYWMAFKKMY